MDYGLISTLLNGLSASAFIVFVVSIPIQIIRRIIRSKANLPVTPLKAIFLRFLKYWLLTALVMIPVSSYVYYSIMQEIGASQQQIAQGILTQTVFGNLITSIFVAYLLLVVFSNKWSLSAQHNKAARKAKQLEKSRA